MDPDAEPTPIPTALEEMSVQLFTAAQVASAVGAAVAAQVVGDDPTEAALAAITAEPQSVT